MHVVYICISVLMNYDCTTHTHPILPFITITTKFLSKHCITRGLDPKQTKNVKFSLSIIETFPGRGGGCMTFQGRCKNSQGRCKTISGEVPTSPHLPSKCGHGLHALHCVYYFRDNEKFKSVDFGIIS
jgi:hypothetical protein